MRMRAMWRQDDGVGLPELLVVMTLLAIVGAIVTTSVVSGYRTQVFAQERVDALTSLHTVVQNVSRDIRVADSRDVTGGPLRSAAADTIVFDVYRSGQRTEMTLSVADPDGDGRWTLTEARRTWADPTVDMSGNPTPNTTGSRPLAARIAPPTTPVFTYHRADGAQLPTPLSAVDLRLVAEVRIDVRAITQAGERPLRVETRIALRNAA